LKRPLPPYFPSEEGEKGGGPRIPDCICLDGKRRREKGLVKVIKPSLDRKGGGKREGRQGGSKRFGCELAPGPRKGRTSHRVVPIHKKWGRVSLTVEFGLFWESQRPIGEPSAPISFGKKREGRNSRRKTRIPPFSPWGRTPLTPFEKRGEGQSNRRRISLLFSPLGIERPSPERGSNPVRTKPLLHLSSLSKKVLRYHTS